MVIDTRNNSAISYQESLVQSGGESYSSSDALKVAASKLTSENKSASNEFDAQKNNEEVAEKIKKAIEQINKHASNTSAKFDYNTESNKITVKIIDVDTEEVIKEFPPEKTLDMISKAWEMVGLLVDEKG